MQENWQQLNQFFSESKRYVLATIVNTQGATYRKIGTMMLITEAGECCGLLSGGCLEADIALHAEQVFSDNRTKLLSYDLKADAELLWGLGLGCDGALDILLQPLNKANDFLDFSLLLNAVNQQASGYYHLDISDNQIASGHFKVSTLAAQANEKKSADQTNDNNINLISRQQVVIPVVPVPSLVIFGAGPDAVPVVNLASQMGWRVSLWDHRARHLEQTEFSACSEKRQIRGEHVENHDFSGIDAVVIMSHNLDNDQNLLATAIAANVSYIGLLGPVGRRDKILTALNFTAKNLKGQVYGPVGLDIGGRSPQAISLSIIAEIQQHMSLNNERLLIHAWREDR
jgi:xanthine dehydrogenase accessory factor